MPDYVATTPGLFPLPDRAKEELEDLKGHQRHDLVSGDEPDAVRDVYATARSDVIELQADVGLEVVVEGQLRWDDMLAHPLCVHDNVETRGLLRYYDNNNFYREPVVTGPLTPDGDLAADLRRAADLADAVQGVVPGPYSLFDLATNDHYPDDAAFLDGIGEFLADEVAEFPDHEALFVLEPSLAAAPPDDGLVDPILQAIDAVSAATDAAVVVHSYWGVPPPRVHARLVDAGVDAIGYDLVTAPEAAVELVEEQGTTDDVALGVVDGQNTLVEDAGTIQERARRVLDRVDVGTVYLTANTELFYLPVNRFEEKLAALAGAARPEAIA